MTTNPRVSSASKLVKQLTCPDCSNSERFIEVMAEEAHIVDGKLQYIRLLHAVVDHYICPDCGTAIETDMSVVA